MDDENLFKAGHKSLPRGNMRPSMARRVASMFLLGHTALNFEVKKSTHGRGLFATDAIKYGEELFTIKATLISDADWKLIVAGKKANPGRNLIELYGLKWGDKHAICLGSIPYHASSGERKYLERTEIFKDGINLHEFNFVNHSSNPNIKEVFGNYTVTCIAVRDIKKGEEIQKDYGPEGVAKFVK